MFDRVVKQCSSAELLVLGFGLKSCRISKGLKASSFISMSFCRLYSIHSLGSRPLNWTCIPREKYNVIARSSGGRSTTGRERYQGSRPERDSEGDGSGMNPLWDSNVESVRRKNRNRSDGRELSSQSASTPDWLTPKKEWTFNPQENRKEEKKAKPEEELPWWKPKYDYDDGETEEEEEDDEDEEEYGNTKSDQVFSSLRWGIPLSLIVLPWLLGNPVVVLLGLAALPAVQRAVGPPVNELWRSFLDVTGSPSQKRRREAEAYDSSSDESDSSWGGERENGQPYRYKKPASYDSSPAEPFPYSDVASNSNRPVSRQDSGQAGQGVSMGGWEDLEVDRRGRMPVRRTRRSSKLGWRSRKKEKPLFVRLLVALFPFLRNWGGWLSLFLFFPFLE